MSFWIFFETFIENVLFEFINALLDCLSPSYKRIYCSKGVILWCREHYGYHKRTFPYPYSKKSPHKHYGVMSLNMNCKKTFSKFSAHSFKSTWHFQRVIFNKSVSLVTQPIDISPLLVGGCRRLTRFNMFNDSPFRLPCLCRAKISDRKAKNHSLFDHKLHFFRHEKSSQGIRMIALSLVWVE